MNLQLLTAKQISEFQDFLTAHELQLKISTDDTIQDRLRIYAHTKTINALKKSLATLAQHISEDESNLTAPQKGALKLIESDLKAHWERIQGSFLCYTRAPKDPINILCLNIAKALYPFPALLPATPKDIGKAITTATKIAVKAASKATTKTDSEATIKNAIEVATKSTPDELTKAAIKASITAAIKTALNTVPKATTKMITNAAATAARTTIKSLTEIEAAIDTRLPFCEGPYFLIMPSLEADKDMADTNIHNFKTHQFVLSDNQTLFIPVAPCLERTGLSDYGQFTQQVARITDLHPKINEHGKTINPNPFLNPLSEQEKGRIIHHSFASETYYQCIKELNEEREMNTSLGAALERLQIALFNGSRLGTTTGKGIEMNAGSDGNEGIIKFAKKWNDVSEAQKNIWYAKYPGEDRDDPNSGFGRIIKPSLKELIDRILRSEKLSYTEVRYCVQLTSADLKTFITNYQDQLFTEPFSAKTVSTDLPIFTKRVRDADIVFKKAIAQSDYALKSGGHFGRLPAFLLSETIEEQKKCLADKTVSNALFLALNNPKSVDMPYFLAAFQQLPQTLKQKLIESHSQTNNRTPLMLAAAYGLSDVIKILLAAGANINAEDSYKYRAILYAINSGQRESMRLLLAGNPNLTLRTSEEQNVLESALCQARYLTEPLIPELCIKIFNSSQEIQKEMLKRVALGKYKDILAWAFDNHPATLSALLTLPNAAEVIIALKTRYGDKVLFEAIRREHQQPLIIALIKNGISINAIDAEKNTPLMSAAKHNHLEAMQALLTENADMTLRNSRNETVWQIALREAPALLPELSIKIFPSAPEVQKSILNSSEYSTVWEWAFAKNPLIFYTLFTLNSTYLFNQLKLRFGNSVLAHVIARKHNHPQLIKTLATTAGVDINYSDQNASSPLMVALRHNQAVATRFLLAQNADITIRVEVNRVEVNRSVLDVARKYAPKLVPELCVKIFEQPEEVQKKILETQSNGRYKDIFVWAFDHDSPGADALLALPNASLKEMAAKIKAVHGKRALYLTIQRSYYPLIPFLNTTDVLNYQNENKNTPLMLAVMTRMGAAISSLLALYPDISLKNQEGKNALAIAVDTDISMVPPLLKHIAFRPKEERKKLLADISLFKAIDLNFNDLTQALIDTEVGINSKEGKDTTLIRAIVRKNWPLAEQLFAKTDLEDRNHEGKNALDLIHKDNPKLIPQLLIKIAERCSHRLQREILKIIENGRYKTVLDYAKAKYPDILPTLSACPNVQKITDNEKRILTAAQKGDLGTMNTLIAAGTDIDNQDNDDENTPLMWAVIHNYTLVMPVLFHNTDINLTLRNKKGSNVLDLALVTAPKLIPQILIKTAVYYTGEEQQELLKNVDGGRYKTIIAFAKAKHPELVPDLLALPNVKKAVDIISVQLLTAVKSGLFTEVQTLITAQGADINIVDAFHNTPLTIAAAHGDEQKTQFLLEQKADPTIRNNKGENVLTLWHKPELLKKAGLTSLTEDFNAAYRYLNDLEFDRQIAVMEQKRQNMRQQTYYDSSGQYYRAECEIVNLVIKLDQAKVAFLRKNNRPGLLMDASNINEFKTTCINALKHARPILKDHREWLGYITNFLWTIISTLVTNQRWNFFFKTDSHRKIDAFEASFEDQNLSAPVA